MKHILSYKVREAILTRADEVQENYIYLSTLMEQQGMSRYFTLARNRIIEMEVSKDFIRKHVVFDFLNNDIWLDIEAVKHYKTILLGYIQEKDFNALLHCMEYNNKLRDIQNNNIRHYRMMSLIELIKTINRSRRQANQEESMIFKQCILELLSRQGFVKLYLYVYKLKTYLDTKNKVHQVLRNVTV